MYVVVKALRSSYSASVAVAQSKIQFSCFKPLVVSLWFEPLGTKVVCNLEVYVCNSKTLILNRKFWSLKLFSKYSNRTSQLWPVSCNVLHRKLFVFGNLKITVYTVIKKR